MARNRRSNPRRFEWVRTAGTLQATADVTAADGTYDAQDLFANVKAQFTGPGGLTDVTVTVVRGYVRPNISTTGAGERFTRGRVGIRVCQETDLTAPLDPAEGPGHPGGTTGTDFGSYLDWMGYMPFALDPTSQDSQINPPATWHSPASMWHVDIESARRIRTWGQTLGIFSESISSPPGGDTYTMPIDYDLSVGIRLP